MNTLSMNGGGDGLWKGLSRTSGSVRTRNWFEAQESDDGSTVNIDLEQGTSILTTGYSRGFSACNLVDSVLVEKESVSGVEISSSSVSFSTYEARQLQTYFVKRVVSPFEFYLEREITTKYEEIWRHQNMQEYYDKQEKHLIEYSITVSKMKCYAYYDRNSETWWRVRVLDFESDETSDRAYIYYCDTGKQESILCEDLRNLPGQFRGVWGSIVLKCYLYDVLPISGDLHWPARSMISFSELIENQRLGAVVMKWSKQPVVEQSPDITYYCGVVLIEKLDNSEIPETINRRMVDLGYARSTGLMSCSAKVLEIPGFVPRFIKETAIRKPKKQLPETSPGLLIGTPIAEVRRIVAARMPDRRPDDRKCTLIEKPQLPTTTVQTKLPKEIKKCLAKVTLSYVEGPDKIFVHEENKKLQLEAMEKEILAVLKKAKQPQPSLQNLKPGSVILCCMMVSQKKPKLDTWCRAFVLEVDLTLNAARVILVDFGEIKWIAHTLLYELPPKYHSIPSFVHRIHLHDIRPKYNSLKWDKPVRKFFFKYVLSFEKQLPAYLVHIAGKEDAVQFVDLDQGLVFNESESKWVAKNPSHSGDGDGFLTSMRSNPLLASHFYSHAVDMIYEICVKELSFWRFEHLSNYLVKRGHAISVKSKVEKNKIHEVIKNGFGFL